VTKPDNPKTKQPASNDQSGSTGRQSPDAKTPTGKDTGQDRYGQSGVAGPPVETDGQTRYRNSANKGDPASKRDSNQGSGRGDADETRKKQKHPIPDR
jgi:hypothetical protein